MSRDWFEGWPGQYRRMLRWRERVRTAIENRLPGDDVYDFIYAFFQASYHLRDWLIGTEACTEEELRVLFAKSSELALCRDICNATKHLDYKRPGIDRAPRIGVEQNPFTKENTWVLHSDKRRPIGDLIKDCVSEWERFLSAKSLLDSSGKPIPFEPRPPP